MALSIVADGGALALVGSGSAYDLSPLLSAEACAERSLTVRYGGGVRAALIPLALETLQQLQQRPSWRRPVREVITHRLSLELCQEAYEQCVLKGVHGGLKVILYPDSYKQQSAHGKGEAQGDRGGGGSVGGLGGSLAASLD